MPTATVPLEQASRATLPSYGLLVERNLRRTKGGFGEFCTAAKGPLKPVPMRRMRQNRTFAHTS